MSDTIQIKDRPYPFDVKTAILQLVGLALTIPKDVADISVEYAGAWGKFDVRVSGATSSFQKDVWLEGKTPDEATKAIEEILAEVNKATANGRQIKAKRLREQAAELLRKASELSEDPDFSVQPETNDSVPR